jgi:DnaA family protein
MQQLLLDLAQPPPPSLANFAAGANTQVLALLQQWLAGALRESCIYLWGPPGCGKTHLLRAVVDEVRAQGVTAEYLGCAPSVRHAGCAAIDDLHRLNEADQAALFTLLDRASRGEMRLLLAGDNAPAGLNLRGDVRTRIGAGLVLQLRPLSDEDKVEALYRHARARGFELPPEAAGYLLRHGRRDLRALLAVLDALDRYSLQRQRPISVALLREVLQWAD